MRSRKPPFLWLLEKESRELVASRALWVMLVVIGPLVGFSFIGAVRTYAELSSSAAGVGEAFSPLIGVWAPTFSACELAAAFLLPFVAIRMVSGDRLSGALKLELQHPMPAFARVMAKAVVLGAGWLIASAAPLAAVVLWRQYGGSVYPPELAAVIVGHLLNAGLTIALAAAAAAIAEHPSTAAILTLSVTVGTWILNFIAAVQGGAWERAAAYTPTAMVSEFQHGLVRLDLVAAAIVLSASGLGIAAAWIRIGVPPVRRTAESLGIGAVALVALVLCGVASASWDLSEARINSFSRPEEAALARIDGPLRMEVHLAAEDPRRVDLERKALPKLRRALARLDVTYVAATTTGLFEQASAQYGEVWYELDGRRTMSRSTTVDGVLEAVFDVAGMTPPAEDEEAAFRGHPLTVPPRRAGMVFYALWPAVPLAGAFIATRRNG